MIDYNGPRTARGLVDEALKVVKNKVDASLGGKSSSGSSGSGGSEGNIQLLNKVYKFNSRCIIYLL